MKWPSRASDPELAPPAASIRSFIRPPSRIAIWAPAVPQCACSRGRQRQMTESGVRAVAASRRHRSALRSAYSALAARGRNFERGEDGAELLDLAQGHRMPSAASGLVLYDIDDE